MEVIYNSEPIGKDFFLVASSESTSDFEELQDIFDVIYIWVGCITSLTALFTIVIITIRIIIGEKFG